MSLQWLIYVKKLKVAQNLIDINKSQMKIACFRIYPFKNRDNYFELLLILTIKQKDVPSFREYSTKQGTFR